MIELKKEEFSMYPQIRELVKTIKSDTVYIYSILEGKQQGRIFVDDLSHI